MFRPVLFAALLAPGLALAMGGDDKPPKSTKTTKTCTNGQVWDEAAKACVNAQDSRLDSDALYGAVRELAYAGRYDEAQIVLAAMPDQTDDRVLVYWGFTTRKLGDLPGGMAYYDAALSRNPGNVLARAYMGQALLETGDLVGAYRQLRAIKAHGGAGSWAETSLRSAIETGQTYNY